ncbi:hypothetical protein [Neobacillus dielmonensis]|uniref:hypothetical protein n=1 Tax=Neobacillus dielmonensis TaxID=1347369 RepID=UPI0005A8C063|nr:hypothetical protein [Neobacillus dielmonensis]
MTKKEREPQFQSGELADKMEKGLYGLDPEMSLLSVSFATTENPYLNEHYQEDSKEMKNDFTFYRED